MAARWVHEEAGLQTYPDLDGGSRRTRLTVETNWIQDLMRMQ
jgi:hypothetical protein